MLLQYSTHPDILAFTTGRDCSLEAVGLKEADIVLPRQTHSDHVRWMREPGRPEDTDAVITDCPGLCVCVKTADCIPVLLYDPLRRIVAAAHAGWRGTVTRIVQKTVREMGGNPSDLCAIIGPGISQGAFEVGDEVYEAFREAGFPMQHIAVRKAKWHIDLWQANRWMLEEVGVSEIQVCGRCTMPLSNGLYSARRDGIQTGRNLNGIMLRSKA